MRAIRSVAAVIAGYLTFGVLSALLFYLSGQDPHATAGPTFKATAIVLGIAFAALGGIVAARIAARRPVAHAVVVGALMAAGAAISWRYAGDPDPWSQQAALLLMSPAAALGGWLVGRRP